EEGDSQDILSALLGKSKKGRKDIVLEAGSKTSYRAGDWVMIPPYKGAKMSWHSFVESGIDMEFQLYNLKEDPSQQNNLAKSNPK
ncbi:hypothetical protein Q4521_22105, partial [Saccharophagus degradans]|nr:hypothetical protein [Saccharophagus degradans]